MASFLGIAVCPLIKVTQQVVWERIWKGELGRLLSGLQSVDSTVLNRRVALHPAESAQERFLEKAPCFVLFFIFVVCVQMHSEGQVSEHGKEGLASGAGWALQCAVRSEIRSSIWGKSRALCVSLLMEYIWHITLCQLNMYNMLIWYVHIYIHSNMTIVMVSPLYHGIISFLWE